MMAMHDAPGAATITGIGAPEKIWWMNKVTAGRSTTSAAASKDLMEKLVADLSKP